MPENAKLLQLRVIYLCDRFNISQDRIWNLDETAVRMVPAGERGWTKRAEPAHVFTSRAFVTVTLAANMRGGMWTQIVYEGKSGRVHPHGPAFPRQLVSHSPTRTCTHALVTPSSHPGSWAASCATPGRTSNCATSSELQPLDRAYMRAFKNSIRQEVAEHFAEFFLEVESNFEHVNLDSSIAVLRQLLLSFVHTAAQNADSPQHRTAGWRFIDWDEEEQRELLAEAKRLLETGELFPHSRGASRARCRNPSQRQRVVEPLADDHSSDGEDTPTGVEESAAPAAPAVAAASERAAMCLLERLQAIRIIYGSKPPT